MQILKRSKLWLIVKSFKYSEDHKNAAAYILGHTKNEIGHCRHKRVWYFDKNESQRIESKHFVICMKSDKIKTELKIKKSLSY